MAILKTVLVVEDDVTIAEDVCRTLRKLGYGVFEPIVAGDAALRMAESTRPSLVLMDVRLAGEMDGVQVAQVLRERMEIPVVFLTEQAEPSPWSRAMTAQPFGYLLKPFSERELALVVEVALQRHELESRLRATSALLQAVLDSMEDGVVATDLEGSVIVANEAERAFAHRRWYLADQTTPCPPERRPLARAMRGETLRGAELFVGPSDHSEGRWQSINASPLRDSGGVVRGSVAVSRDVTDVKAMQLELQRLSLLDDLTGLHNRRAFQALAEQHLKLASRTRRLAALFFADLDGLKEINDSLGHQEGDLALRDTARLLRESFRDSDIVARLGGDEFVVLALEVDSSRVEALSERVRRNIEAFNARRTRAFTLALSVGVCVADPSDTAGLAALMSRADALMYEDKLRRRGEVAKMPSSWVKVRSAPEEQPTTQRGRRR
jgi:diguanylate cyclase (GGDEF)-like protein